MLSELNNLEKNKNKQTKKISAFIKKTFLYVRTIPVFSFIRVEGILKYTDEIQG